MYDFDYNPDTELDPARTTSTSPYKEQHVHELIGSVTIAGSCGAHNHRFATVSDEAIPCKGSHVHKVSFRTDSYDGHYHEFCGTTSAAIPVGDGRHVHYVSSLTTSAEDGHTHKFRAASLIDDPVECK